MRQTGAFFWLPFWIARLNHELGDAYVMQKGDLPGRNGRKNSNWIICKPRDEEELLRLETQMPHHVLHQFFKVAAVLCLKTETQRNENLLFSATPKQRKYPTGSTQKSMKENNSIMHHAKTIIFLQDTPWTWQDIFGYGGEPLQFANLI